MIEVKLLWFQYRLKSLNSDSSELPAAFSSCAFPRLVLLTSRQQLIPRAISSPSGTRAYPKDIKSARSLLPSPLSPTNHCRHSDPCVNSAAFLKHATEPWFSIGTGKWKPHLPWWGGGCHTPSSQNSSMYAATEHIESVTIIFSHLLSPQFPGVSSRKTPGNRTHSLKADRVSDLQSTQENLEEINLPSMPIWWESVDMRVALATPVGSKCHLCLQIRDTCLPRPQTSSC